jgi:hypothetical protein
VRKEYDRLGPVYAPVGAMVEARHEVGLTQEEIARRMGTTSLSLPAWKTRAICRAWTWSHAMPPRSAAEFISTSSRRNVHGHAGSGAVLAKSGCDQGPYGCEKAGVVDPKT